MKTFSGLLLCIGAIAFRYFVMFKLYGYFCIPVGFPILTTLQMVGLTIFLHWVANPGSYLSVQWKKFQRKEVGMEEDDNALYEGGTSLINSLIMWGVGATLFFQFM